MFSLLLVSASLSSTTIRAQNRDTRDAQGGLSLAETHSSSSSLPERRALDRASARDQVIYQNDHGYNQQDVNQAATDVTDEPQ